MATAQLLPLINEDCYQLQHRIESLIVTRMYRSNAEKEYIAVTVHNPTIHNTYEEGRYTTFDVELQTNSLSFTTKQSVVQRRYSDFQWLRKALARTTGGSPPSLPFGRLFGTFDEDFLTERQKVLTNFMQKIVRDTLFISSSALHLFLQTELSRKDMDSVIKEAKRRGSMNAVARAISVYGPRYNRMRSRHSVASLAGGGTSFYDNLTSSQSLPHFRGILQGPDAVSASVSSISDLSTSACNDCFSSKDSQLNLDMQVGSIADAENVDYTEKDCGEWVLIESSSQVSKNLINSCLSTVPHSPISSEDYTKVSWSIGDSPSSSKKVARPSSSSTISVPIDHQVKRLEVGPLTTQSLSSVTSFHCDSLDSESFQKGIKIRRVASESSIVDKYLSLPPLSLSFSSDTTKKKDLLINQHFNPKHSTPQSSPLSFCSSRVPESTANVQLTCQKLSKQDAPHIDRNKQNQASPHSLSASKFSDLSKKTNCSIQEQNLEPKLHCQKKAKQDTITNGELLNCNLKDKEKQHTSKCVHETAEECQEKILDTSTVDKKTKLSSCKEDVNISKQKKFSTIKLVSAINKEVSLPPKIELDKTTELVPTLKRRESTD